jgi:hypothetical protein
MGRWAQFFLGTPQRFLGTCLGIGLVICIVDPTVLTMAVDRLMIGLAPLLGPALAVVIVFAGIRMILGGGRR